MSDILGPSGQVIGGDGPRTRQARLEEAVAGLENVRVQLMRTVAILVNRLGGEVEVNDAEMMTASYMMLEVAKHPIKGSTIIRVKAPGPPEPEDDDGDD